MKKNTMRFLACVVAAAALVVSGRDCGAQTNQPKRLLVVTVTKEYRHASIATGQKIVEELAKKDGGFTVDSVGTEAEMAAKMTGDALKNYDGAIFISTTGHLPLPDKQAFLDWIKSGKGFVGVHAATDAFHVSSGVDPYIQMIGGEFLTHTVATVDCINEDTTHPATKNLGKTWQVTDEIYFQKNFSRDNVHMLLSLDKMPGGSQPGYFPIAWCKKYGEGNVFYTALGHTEEMWRDPQFQKHLLGGIRWSLGLEKGDATPQAVKANN
jgi:type 1 glutamine amidotransferase